MSINYFCSVEVVLLLGRLECFLLICLGDSIRFDSIGPNALPLCSNPPRPTPTLLESPDRLVQSTEFNRQQLQHQVREKKKGGQRRRSKRRERREERIESIEDKVRIGRIFDRNFLPNLILSHPPHLVLPFAVEWISRSRVFYSYFASRLSFSCRFL